MAIRDRLLTTGVALLLVASYLICAQHFVDGDRLGLDHFSLIFESDPSRVIENSTTFFGDQARTRAHPLHIVLVAPLGLVLTAITGSATWAAVLITAVAAGLVLLNLERILVQQFGLSLWDRLLFVILLGATASHVTFGAAIPETHILSALGLSFMTRCLTKERIERLRRPGHTALSWLKEGGAAPIAASILAVGMIVTTVAVLPVFFFYLTNTSARSRWRRALSPLRVTAAIVAVVGTLHLSQRALWPPVRGPVPTSIPTFLVQDKGGEGTIPHWNEQESKGLRGKIDYVIHSLKSNTAWTTASGDLLSRVPHVVNTVFVNALFAPEFRVQQAAWQKAPQVTFEPWASSHRWFGGVGGVAWLTLLGVSVVTCRRDWRSVVGNPATGFCGILLAFHLALFTLYGDEVFLFSPNWVLPLVVVAAGFYGHALRAAPARAWPLRALLGLAVICIVANSMSHMRALFDVYS